MNLKDTIRTIPDWPIKGVMFRDITTLIQNPKALAYVCDTFYERYKDMKIDKIAAIDARGFIFGANLAYKLGIGLVPIRKKGKLPFKTVSAEYTLEYGKNEIEMHCDAIKEGERVVLVDDLLATGGTIAAAAKIIGILGGEIVECALVIELIDLKGREKMKNHKIFKLVDFEGE